MISPPASCGVRCSVPSKLPNGISVFTLTLPGPPENWLVGSPPTTRARACIGQSAPGNYWLILADAPDQPNVWRSLTSLFSWEMWEPLDKLPDHLDRLPEVKDGHRTFWLLDGHELLPELCYYMMRHGILSVLQVLHPEKGILSPAVQIKLKPTELAYFCGGCDEVERFGAEKRYQRCGGCQMWYYCSVKCQKDHWTNKHKAECKLWAAGEMGEIKKLREASQAAGGVEPAGGFYSKLVVHKKDDLPNVN